MQTVLIVIHLMVVVALVVIVLLQRSEGGALGVGGGGGFMTGRGQANALTRATAILAAIFFATSLLLTVIATYGRAPKSILDQATPAAPGAPAEPARGNLLDQLRQREQGAPGPAPSTPAPPPAPGVGQPPAAPGVGQPPAPPKP